ncbi:MFS general substrate transporter [Mycena rebaudengoi]|nr:MFS general substrate transporter [Mycena rebaudengoi]
MTPSSQDSVRTQTVDTYAADSEPTQPKVDVLSAGSGTVVPPTFPEGGLQAWCTVAGAFLIQFCGFGYTTSFGVYQDFYVREYLSDSSSSAISWIGSVNALLVISWGLVAGRFYDRGHFHALVYGGCLLSSFSLFMLSLCKPQQFYQIFLAQGLGAGLAAGTVYIPSVAVVSHYFQKRRAFAMSIVASGSSLGAVIHPIMLNNTFHRLGFANAVRASAGLVSGMLLIACLLMRPRLPPPKTNPQFFKSLRRFGRDRAFVFLTAAMSTYTIGFYFPLFYLQLDAVTHGIDQTFAFYSLVILNASSFFGRLAPGMLAQKLGVLNMVTGAAGCGAVLILGMIGLDSVASVVVIGVIYGFCAGVFVTLMAPLVALLTDDIGELGLRMGVAFAFVGIGGLIGPPINGALLTKHFVWWRPALFSGLMAMVGFGFFAATLITVRRRNARKVVAHNATGVDEKRVEDA